jgi:hypothetical protein
MLCRRQLSESQVSRSSQISFAFLVFDSLAAYYLLLVLSYFAVNFCFGHATVLARFKGVLLTLECNRDLENLSLVENVSENTALIARLALFLA